MPRHPSPTLPLSLDAASTIALQFSIMHFSQFGPAAMFRRTFRPLLTLLLVLVAISSVFAVSKKDTQNLPPRYKDWLAKEVNYIITEEEAQAFVHLSTDAERDTFIARFWEIRNPEPNSPTNRYKEEIAQRIAYANQWFGHEQGTPGWMTDMGRVYITLGPPKQRNKLLLSANERPMEIWFYDNGNGALPPFFYVVFYQKDTTSDFRMYSPYMDGPQALVTSYQAENGRLQAWRLIDHDLGREVARTTLSLIPSEPVDMDTASSSLMSDSVLSTIRGLKDNPWTKAQLEQRRRLLEDVSHNIVLADEFLYVQTVPLRDERGNTNVHYLLRLKRPEDFAIAQNNDNRWYYSAEVSVKVSSAEKKLIFTQQRTLSHYLSQEEFDRDKGRVFGYEGVLPLPPGKYNIEFILTNKLKKTAYRSEKEIIVPETPATGMRLSDIVPFAEASAAAANELMPLPFQVANVKFTPGVAQDLVLIQGQPLTFFYQIWTQPTDPKTYGDAKITAEYAYGRMGLHDTKTVVDELNKSQFSANGSMVNGKKIDTTDLPPGGYRLSISVTDPATREKAYGTLSFRVQASGGSPESWDVVDPDLLELAKKGVFDYQRAQCYLSTGNTVAGATWLESAFQKNPDDEAVRTKLVDSFFAKQDFKQVTAVYSRSPITTKTDEQTILRIAESFDKLGQPAKSVELLESAVTIKPQSGPLYLSLAGFYQRMGNTQKATEMEQKGRSLVASASPSGS
jgi:GWxTD domain-containing protein